MFHCVHENLMDMYWREIKGTAMGYWRVKHSLQLTKGPTGLSAAGAGTVCRKLVDCSATSAGTSAVMEDLAAMGRCHGMAESVGAVTGGLAAKARCNGILQREQ